MGIVCGVYTTLLSGRYSVWGVHNSCGYIVWVYTTLVGIVCRVYTTLLSGRYSVWGVHNTCGYSVWGVHNSFIR